MFHTFCDTCHTEFKSKSSKRLFCSQSCAAKKNNTLREKKNKTTCGWCGVDMWFKKGSSFGRYCSNKCSSAEAAKKAVTKNIELLQAGKLVLRPAIKKALLALGLKEICSVCGIHSWLGQKLILALDHIDGDASNNNIDNFRLLCPNCDSQSRFYKGRNRGRGRTTLGIRKRQKLIDSCTHDGVD